MGVNLIPTAIEMVHLKIACRIRPALRFLHNTANIPRGALCDSRLTDRTQAILAVPDAVKFPSILGRTQHFLAPAGLEIRRPCWIMRIGVGFDLDMPLYRRIRFAQQDEFSSLPIFWFFCGGKCPGAGASGFEMLLLDPWRAFTGMPSYSVPRTLRCFVTLSGSLFIQIPRFAR